MIIKNWQKSIDSVVKWAEDRGINVCFGKDLEDQFCYKERVIHINTNQTKENRFYVLLHECGHYLISMTSSNFVRDMPLYKGFTGGEDGRVARSKAYHVSLVAEETEAWRRGRNLARRLGESIDNKRYDNMMANCVYTYIKY